MGVGCEGHVRSACEFTLSINGKPLEGCELRVAFFAEREQGWKRGKRSGGGCNGPGRR